MKKPLITLIAMAVLSAGAVQAAQTNTVSSKLNSLSEKVEKAETNAYNKAEANKKAFEARQKERQKALDEQKAALEKKQKENQAALDKAKSDAKARQEARQKTYETKKKQWKDLLTK